MKNYTRIAMLLLIMTILVIEIYVTFWGRENYNASPRPAERIEETRVRPAFQGGIETRISQEGSAHQAVLRSANEWAKANPEIAKELEKKVEVRAKVVAQEQAIAKKLAEAQRKSIAKTPARIAAEKREKDLDKQLEKGKIAGEVYYARTLANQPFPLIVQAIKDDKIKYPQGLRELLSQVQKTQGAATNGIVLAQVLGAVKPTSANIQEVFNFLSGLPAAESGPIVTKMQTVSQSDMQKIVDGVNSAYQAKGQTAINDYIAYQTNKLSSLMKSGNATVTDVANLVQVVQEVSFIPENQPETIKTLPPWALTLIAGGLGAAVGATPIAIQSGDEGIISEQLGPNSWVEGSSLINSPGFDTPSIYSW